MKLIQKHLFKGIQEFEIIDDYVKLRSKAPFKDEVTMTVMLTVLNPDPVITKSSLDFTSRVNGETLLSLYLGKPDTEAFNAFAAALKNKAMEEYQAFAGLRNVQHATGLGANVYDEPPAMDEPGTGRPPRFRKDLDIDILAESIQMLKTYLNTGDILPFLTALETLKSDPKNESYQIAVINAFNALGPTQGAVLTYAPYVGILLSDGPSDSAY